MDVLYLPSLAINANGFMIARGVARTGHACDVYGRGRGAYMMFGSGRSLVASPPDEQHYEDGRIASSLQEAFIEDDEGMGESGVKSPV